MLNAIFFPENHVFWEMRMGCGDWMHLAQDRARWQSLVSTVMNFRVL